VIQTPFFPFSEVQFTLRLRGDLPLVMLGSVIAAIGFGALVVQVFRRHSRERFLLWFGLFACPYGLRLITNTSAFQLAFGEPQRFWLFVGAFVDLAMIVPALLLLQDFYGKGWRSSVRGLIWVYVIFATVAFASMLIANRPDLFPAAGIGTVFLLPLIVLWGRLAGYQRPRIEDQSVLSLGLLSLFLTFAHDRFVSAQLLTWHVQIEPYGLFILICCMGYATTRRVLANERQLASLGEEMRAATRIQTSILPRTMPELRSLSIAARYAPMSAVAGDFYDFLAIQPGCLGIIVADVAGHGVPAALVASMVKVAVSSRISEAEHPGKIMAGLNSTLCGEAEGQYATAVYVYLDAERRVGCYSAGGHPPPLLWQRTTRTLLRLNESGLLLGVRPGEHYSQAEFSLQAGDRLLIYTDGLVEATNPDGLEFGDARLEDFINTHEDLSADRFAERVLQAVLAWPVNGNPQSQADDITIVVIDVGPSQ
jgi:sigma-B regulation protein RsbU (phosphoserine phosphatase)